MLRTSSCFAACLATALIASLSFAAEKPYSVGVEVSPISLLSLIPQLTLAGGGVEAALHPNVSLAASAGVMAFEFTDEQIAKLKETEGTAKPLLHGMHSVYVAPGLRYYFSGAGDSAYLASHAKLSVASLQFEKDGEVYETEGRGVDPAVELGYRWRWSSGFVIRLGLAASVEAHSESKTVRRSDGHELSSDEEKALNSDDVEKATESRDISSSTTFTLGFVF